MSRTKFLNIRLSAGEQVALRKHPGANDSERVRALIHNAAIFDSLAAEVSKKLAVLLAKSLAESERKNDQNFRRALDAFASQLSPILSKLLSNTQR